MNIRLIKQADIDKTKWNSCVHFATNGNVFGYRWFLDNIAKEWDALVEEDYESVMPLIWRENSDGQKEIYQPSLIRESGIYSISLISAARLKAFLDKIPAEYSRINLHLNEGTNHRTDVDFSFEKKWNHQLLVNQSYEKLAANYSDTLKEKLGQASDFQLRPSSAIKPEAVADFFKANHPNPSSIEKKYHGSMRIMYNVLHRGWGFSSAIENKQGDLLAAGFFIFSHGKILTFLASENAEGKEKGALALLYDLLIRTNAGKPVLLDFNSKKEDAFPLGFGAEESFFYKICR